MKKILSLVLVLCMLASSCILFSSCSKISAKDFEKDPIGAMNEAVQNMTQEFFTDDAEMGKVLAKAFEMGSLTISFESPDLLGGDLTKISETVYMDTKNQKYVSDTAVTYSGDELGARIFFDKNGIALNGEAIFGDKDTTLALNFATFADKFADSMIPTIFDIDEDTVDEVVEVISTMQAAYEQSMETDTEEAEQLAKDMLNELQMTISTEKKELANGKTTDCVVVSYKLTNDTIEKYMTKSLEALDDGELKDTYEESLITMLDELTDMVDINLTAKVYTERKTNKMIGVTLTGEVQNKTEDEKIQLTLDTIFTKEEISLTAEIVNDEETTSISGKLTKENTDGKVIYKLTIDSTMNSVTTNLLNGSYSYDKKNGDIVLAADIFTEEGEDRTEFEVKGNIAVTNDEVVIEITSVTLDSITVTFKAIVSFKTLDSIPSTPANTLDIVEMTQGEWLDILTALQESPVGQLIFGMAY